MKTQDSNITDFGSTRTSSDGQYIVTDGLYKSKPFDSMEDALTDADTCIGDENFSGEVVISDGAGVVLWQYKDKPEIM